MRDHIRAHGSVEGIDRSTVTFPDFKLVTAPQKNKVKEEPQECTGEPPLPQKPAKTTAQPTKKAAKPRKPRVSKKKETAAAAQQPAPNVSSSNPVPPASHQQKPFPDNTNLQHQQYHMQQQSTSSFNGVSSMAAAFSQPAKTSPHDTSAVTGPVDFVIKQEVTDPHRTDRDLERVLRQNFGRTPGDIISITQGLNSAVATRPNFLPHNMVLPTTTQSSLKQERPDWAGYGVMPNATTIAPPVSTYSPYAYWPYLGCPTSNAFMPYQSIPNSQMPHPQVAVTLNSPTVAQPNASVPVTATYSSPQEASSPAMSSQSNLTQASLDSLPKADSASTVANWLQNIPNMSVAQ